MKTPTAHEFLPLRAPEEGRLYLDHLGWHQCPPGWRCGPAARDYYLFHFILDGCGTVARKGAVRRLAAGKSFLLRPGDSVVYCADPETPWSYCYFGLRGQDVPRYLEKTVFSGAAGRRSWETFPFSGRSARCGSSCWTRRFWAF